MLLKTTISLGANIIIRTYVHIYIYIRIIIKELEAKKKLLMSSHNNMSIRAIAITPSKIMALFNVVASINSNRIYVMNNFFQCVNGWVWVSEVCTRIIWLLNRWLLWMMNLICLRSQSTCCYFLGTIHLKIVILNQQYAKRYYLAYFL